MAVWAAMVVSIPPSRERSRVTTIKKRQ